MTKRVQQPAMLLLNVLLAALCYAQEPVVVRLRDAVGDTIDLAERDSFRLFPRTEDFRHAVMLALPGPEFYAEIATGDSAAGRRFFLRVMPRDLERIRLLVDNHEETARRQESDSVYARSIASFWQSIEERPLRDMSGEPLLEEELPPAPPAPLEPATPYWPGAALGVPGSVTLARPLVPPVSAENRFTYTLHGATLGSLAGALLGSWTGIGGFSSVILAAAGSYGGYQYGSGLDRKATAPWSGQGEGHTWRTCCGVGCGLNGLVLGATAAALIGSTAKGNLPWVPAVLSGVCIAVEITTLGYHLGRSIDRGRKR